MPIRQNILRKGKAPKQNLLGFDVFQEETGVLGDLSTSRFFKISEFPSVLPTGNSSFLIEGSDLLKPNVEVKTELLDSAGNPIFHYAIPNYDKELPSRRITIEVYEDDIINGIGSFTILGELDPQKFEVPTAFQDTYNVRFSAPVSINKKIKNTEPIRFYGDPTIKVSELVKGVIEKVPTGDSSKVSLTGSVEFINSTPQVEFSVDNTSTTGNSNQFKEVGNSVASYVNQNKGSAQSSILPQITTTKKPFTFVVKSMEKGIDNALNKITSGMKGATFNIKRPDLLVDNTLYPDSKFDKPQTFETKILDVINSTTFTTTTEYTITNKSNNNKIIVPLSVSSSGVNSSVTHSVVSSTETEDQVFKRSFANMTVGNLRTFSGDTYKAKIYMKEEGTSGEFEKIYETLVESPNELVNPNSISGFENIGLFFTQSIIDNNWTTSSAQAPATQNDDTIIDGVLLSGSNAELGSSFTFVTNTNLELEKNEDYIVEFNAAFKEGLKTQSDGTTKQQAELEVFITGSLESETGGEISLGTVDLPDTTNTDFTIIQQRQIADFRTHNESSTPTGSLGFRVNSGEFILSDIRLRPFAQTNFSPGFFKANVPMSKPIKRGQPYDFVVEFYDANNNLAEAVAVADDITFVGPPQIIADGADGLLTGSMFLGSVTGSGIELHGGSAYMRSIGYDGFNDTISNNVGGFLIFSGSVSESMGTTEDYEGVGLEIVDAHGDTDRFLKFRTNPSEFIVQTDQFFFGKDGQFISGSNGNIVISSSNFFLGGGTTFISGSNDKLEISSDNFSIDVDGNLTASGFISASGGFLGDFEINDGKISGSNITLDANTSTIFKTDQGPGSDTEAAFDQVRDEYYIDFTPEEESPDNYYIKMGPNFMVDKDGILIASGATFTGTITASAGLIGGFATDSSSFSSPAGNTEKHIVISGSPSFGGDDDSKFMFISTSHFNVKENGDITASAALITGSVRVAGTGEIGGFGLTLSAISSSNNNLILSSSGQITGSSVLFDGGTIGGFELASTQINDTGDNLVLKSSGQITGSSVLFDGGTIGGFELGSTIISSSNDNLVLKSSGQITGSDVLFDGGRIGGFTITDTNLETTDFVSGEKGIRLSTAGNGSLEVEEAKIRGTLKTTVFEKESVNAVGGQLVVANATIITGSDVGKADTTMSVENVTGFVPDEILFIQKVSGSGFSKEYIQVISSSNDFNSDTNFQGKLMVSRSFGSSATYNASLHSGSLSTTADTGSTYTPGQVIVSTGKLNTGYIKLNANPNDITTPYIDIVERTGSGVFDVDLKARLGDLSGLSSGLVGSSPGFGLFSENVFLTGKITATSGDIAGWEIDSNILKSGTNIQLDSGNEKITISDQTFGNTGIQLEHNSGTPRAHIGKSNGEGFKFDGTNVVMSASSFQLGNNATFVSGSNGNVKISGSSVDIQTPAFVFGDLNKAFISGSNGNLELSASNFILGTSASNAAGGNTGVGAYVSSSNNNLRISSSGFDLNSIGNVGTLNIANGKLTFDGSDLSVDGTITANDGTIGGFHIGSTSLHAGDNGIGSVNTKMVFRDITNGGVPKFSLGTSANSITLTNGDGVYMDGGGDFRVGDADGERIQFDESESELILSASAFKLGNQTSFVSGSNGNVKISGSSIDFQTPAFVLGDLNKAFISGSNGNLELSASNFILGTSGSNAAGGETGVGAYVSASNGKLRISASNFDLNDNGNFDFANGKLTFNGSTLAVNGAVTATSGDIGGWNINSNDLVGGAVRLEREGIVSATGSTSVGGATKQTKALFSGSADRGSVVSIQRDDFNGDLLDLVELHTSQSYVDDVLLSYASGSDRDDVTFTRSGTSSDQSETLTFAAGGSGAGAWPSNIFLRASGTGATNGKKVVIETAMADNQLLDTQEANNVVEIAFLNLTEEFQGSPVSSNVGKALVRYKIEIFQNDSNTATGAELLKTFNISSTLTLGASASAVNINQPIVLNKRYFFAKITGTNYDELSSADGDDNSYKFSQTAAPIVAVKYLPKVKLNGVGFQTFAGPNQEVKLGAKNEIIGDLQLKETVADTRGNLQVEGKGAFGTLTIDDTFDLFVDGEIGATGNITGFYSSDKRLKENIVEIKEGLSIINQLRPVKFDWKDDSPFAHLYPTEYGLIAQEVEKIIPEIVGTMKQDYKGINYESLVPLLISSIIELTKRVKKLEDK